MDNRPEVHIVAESTTPQKTYCCLYKPDGTTIGGNRSALERYARANGWRPVFVPETPKLKVEHGF